MRSTLMQSGAHHAAKLHHSSSSPSALSILVHCIFVAGLMLLARTSLLIALPLCSTDLAGQGNARTSMLPLQDLCCRQGHGRLSGLCGPGPEPPCAADTGGPAAQPRLGQRAAAA